MSKVLKELPLDIQKLICSYLGMRPEWIKNNKRELNKFFNWGFNDWDINNVYDMLSQVRHYTYDDSDFGTHNDNLNECLIEIDNSFNGYDYIFEYYMKRDKVSRILAKREISL
jgi:hypothetical protein